MKNEKGFTLIELMVVIAIIGILAAIAIPQFSQLKYNSYKASAQSDLRNLKLAQEAYFTDYGQYSLNIGELINDYIGVVGEHSVVYYNNDQTMDIHYELAVTDERIPISVTQRVYHTTDTSNITLLDGDVPEGLIVVP